MAGNSPRIAVQVSMVACGSHKHSARLSTFELKVYEKGDAEVAVDSGIGPTNLYNIRDRVFKLQASSLIGYATLEAGRWSWR